MTANEYDDDPAASVGASVRDGPDGVDDGSLCRRRRWTTIVLEECSGGWRATQTGVVAEGYGSTAADAAVAYCQRIAGTDGRGAGGRDTGSREDAR
ncbi:hypothetical protein [Halosimplex sp. J119]